MDVQMLAKYLKFLIEEIESYINKKDLSSDNMSFVDNEIKRFRLLVGESNLSDEIKDQFKDLSVIFSKSSKIRIVLYNMLSFFVDTKNPLQDWIVNQLYEERESILLEIQSRLKEIRLGGCYE